MKMKKTLKRKKLAMMSFKQIFFLNEEKNNFTFCLYKYLVFLKKFISLQFPTW